jgi:hypothetical protein
MTLIHKTLLLICISGGVATLPQDSGWRGIVPLHASREDVERLLGAPAKPGTSLYETKDESVHILYSGTPCEATIEGSWNVPPETVLRVTVSPKKETYLEDLGLDESRYKKIDDPHIGGLLTYADEERGVSIKISYERLVNTQYGPAAADKQLRCTSPEQ